MTFIVSILLFFLHSIFLTLTVFHISFYLPSFPFPNHCFTWWIDIPLQLVSKYCTIVALRVQNYFSSRQYEVGRLLICGWIFTHDYIANTTQKVCFPLSVILFYKYQRKRVDVLLTGSLPGVHQQQLCETHDSEGAPRCQKL